MNTDNLGYIPIREAVLLTGMCAQTLRKLCDEKKIDFYKTESGQRKFSKKSLENLCRNTVCNNTLVCNSICDIKSDKTCVNDNDTSNPHFYNKRHIEKKRLNIYYLHENTLNIYSKIENIKKNKLFDNYIIISEENGIYKLIDYCLKRSNVNIVITDNYFNYNMQNEYNMLKYIIEKTDNNIIEISINSIENSIETHNAETHNAEIHNA